MWLRHWTESNECTHSCEPVDSNFCPKSGGLVKCECLDTCSVEVNVCGASVDGHDSSNSLKRCVSSSRSEDDVASNEDVDVNRECSDSDCVLSVDVNSVNTSEVFPFQLNKNNKQLQCQDVDLAPYIEYLEHSVLPPDELDARKVVLGSKQYEMIDGILH